LPNAGKDLEGGLKNRRRHKNRVKNRGGAPKGNHNALRDGRFAVVNPPQRRVEFRALLKSGRSLVRLVERTVRKRHKMREKRAAERQLRDLARDIPGDET
jgi:uncharacterized protein YjcR